MASFYWSRNYSWSHDSKLEIRKEERLTLGYGVARMRSCDVKDPWEGWGLGGQAKLCSGSICTYPKAVTWNSGTERRTGILWHVLLLHKK